MEGLESFVDQDISNVSKHLVKAIKMCPDFSLSGW